MQQFTVPQFIDVEDKILGPLTVRQFLTMMSAFIMCGILWPMRITFVVYVILCVAILMVHAIFAFYKVNSMPFHFFVLNVLQSLKRPSLRVWSNEYGKGVLPDIDEHKEIQQMFKPKKKYSKSRLAELSLIVDTQGTFKGDEKRKAYASKEKINYNLNVN